MSEKINLGFINDDVSTQLTRSRQIIEAAERLREVLPLVKDQEAQKKIEEQIRTLVDAATGLTANATSTSSSAATLTITSSKR